MSNRLSWRSEQAGAGSASSPSLSSPSLSSPPSISLAVARKRRGLPSDQTVTESRIEVLYPGREGRGELLKAADEAYR